MISSVLPLYRSLVIKMIRLCICHLYTVAQISVNVIKFDQLFVTMNTKVLIVLILFIAVNTQNPLSGTSSECCEGNAETLKDLVQRVTSLESQLGVLKAENDNLRMNSSALVMLQNELTQIKCMQNYARRILFMYDYIHIVLQINMTQEYIYWCLCDIAES